MGKTKRFILSFIFLSMVYPGFSMYFVNKSDSGFEEGTTGQAAGVMGISSTTPSMSMKDLISKQAAYFLKGKSSIDLLAAKLEAADHEGVCFYQLQTIVGNALNDLRSARFYNKALVDKAKMVPYNEKVIYRLMTFGYDGLKKEYGLNGEIYSQVTGFLQRGDIRGAFARVYSDMDTIVNQLEALQKSLNYWYFPENRDIWKLNQSAANLLLFGQYMSQTFYNL